MLPLKDWESVQGDDQAQEEWEKDWKSEQGDNHEWEKWDKDWQSAQGDEPEWEKDWTAKGGCDEVCEGRRAFARLRDFALQDFSVQEPLSLEMSVGNGRSPAFVAGALIRNEMGRWLERDLSDRRATQT